MKPMTWQVQENADGTWLATCPYKYRCDCESFPTRKEALDHIAGRRWSTVEDATP